MQKRALITGIGGQDGSLLAELLLDQGYDVSGIVRRSGASYPNLEPIRERIDLVEADLSDQLALVRALRAARPHEVYNLASVSFVPASWEQPVLTAELAAVGVTALLEAIREVDAAIRFYQASSSEIFGEPRESPQTEETPLSPLTPYGVAKAYAHFIVRSYRIRYGLHASAGILYNHESPRRPLEFVPRKVAHAAAAISLGLEGELWLGDLDSRRDWGYAGDYVRAMWLMVQQDEGDDYVVATGVTRSVRDLVETAFEHVGLDSREYVHIDESLQRGTAELHNLVGDPAKAQARARLGADGVVRGARPADGRRRARAPGSGEVQSSELAVDRVVLARARVPRERRRALGPDAPPRGDRLERRRRDRLGVERVEVDRRVAATSRQRRQVGARHGARARERLEHRLAEALVEAREDERGRAAVELDELVLRHATARRPRSRGRRRGRPSARAAGRGARGAAARPLRTAARGSCAASAFAG